MGSHARIMSKDSKEGLFDSVNCLETTCTTLTIHSENSIPSITFNPYYFLEMMNSIARFYYSLLFPMRELIQDYYNGN